MKNNLKNFRDRLTELLTKGETFALAYHPDADGICAAKILIQHLLKSGVERANIHCYPTNTDDRVMQEYQVIDILEKAPDIAIYLDLCNHLSAQIDRLRQRVRYVASIDHHLFKEGWPENFDLYINSKFFEELTRPQVHTASKLLNTIFYNGRNDWLEIIGLEGDVAIPSMPGTLSHEATQILNLLGLIQRDNERPEERDRRCNTLLSTLIDSDNLPAFLENFRRLEGLSKLYKMITEDIDRNVGAIKRLHPKMEFHSTKIYVCPIEARSGYEIIGQVLKGHFPYLGYNSIYILHQGMQTKGAHLIFLYTSNPWIDCFRIASAEGHGGGHTNRAGLVIRGQSIEKTLDGIIGAMKEMILKGEAEDTNSTPLLHPDIKQGL